MRLLTIFKENEKVVYGTAVCGKLFFFFSGFNSIEEAKQTVIEAHITYKLEKSTNQEIKPLIRTQVEMSLDGEWSEIE